MKQDAWRETHTRIELLPRPIIDQLIPVVCLFKWVQESGQTERLYEIGPGRNMSVLLFT